MVVNNGIDVTSVRWFVKDYRIDAFAFHIMTIIKYERMKPLITMRSEISKSCLIYHGAGKTILLK